LVNGYTIIGERVKRAFSGVMLLVVINAFAMANGVQLVTARTIVVPDDYLTIQEALNAAGQGDIVFARSGRYNETITVDKALLLIGENKETTFICGGHKGTVVQVDSDNVTISGFSIESSREEGSAGVGLNLRADCSIVGNILANNWFGIGVFGCHNINVTDNIMTNDHYGLAGDSCSNCHMTGNTFSDCWGGIGIDDSSDIEIGGNEVSNCEAFGIVSDYPMNNNYIGGNQITGCYCGICLNFLADFNETGNTITGNKISNNQRGGIELYHSSNTMVTANEITGNQFGINLDPTSLNNTVYHNNFLNNSVHADSHLPNMWDGGYSSGGNYWSSYLGVDIYKGASQNVPGSDGKVDAPHVMNSNNVDHYPLAYVCGSPAPPAYTLLVSATVGGATSPSSGSYIYAQAQNVPVEATPSMGYSLHHWELDGINIGAQTLVSVAMNSNRNLLAMFAATPYDATVCAHCNSENSNLAMDIMIDGTSTGFTTPHTFSGLTGAHTFTVASEDANGHPLRVWSTGQDNATITVISGGTYTAMYDAKFMLAITSSEGGNTNPMPATYAYWSGTRVSILAISGDGYYLNWWLFDGVSVGAPNPIGFKADSNHTLQAVFAQFSIGHGVAVKYVFAKTVVGQGFLSAVKVTAMNVGSYTETFNVTTYAVATPIAYQTVTLAKGNSTTVAFTWKTTGFAKGNYSISACAEPVADETDTSDNNLTNGWVIVAMIGDITGPNDGYPDGKVDVRDVAGMAVRYGAKMTDPRYDVDWDITGPTPGLADGRIDVRDVSLVCRNYGQHDP
jgi:parallel beta-helix repeat protein